MSDGELISITIDDDETTVSFSPDNLNRAETARLISSGLCQLIEREQATPEPIQQIVLDFKDIDRLGSAGLNGLIRIKSKVRHRGVRLILANVRESVRDVFAVTRLERSFEFQSAKA